MKLNITIDLDDFCYDFEREEETFKEKLKREIEKEAASEVLLRFSGAIRTYISDTVMSTCKSVIEKEIDKVINNLDVQKIVGYWHGGETYTISEYVHKYVKDNGSCISGRLESKIKTTVDKTLLELKEEYNKKVVTELMTRMAENGFLKEGIADFLLTNDKEKEEK